MDSPFSPYEMKELAIEWILRKDPVYYTVYNIPKTSLEDMCFMDADNLDINTIGHTPIPEFNLDPALERNEQEEKRLEFLKELIIKVPSNPKLSKQINDLMDQEIGILGLTDTTSPQAEFSTKARTIAFARVMAQHPGIAAPEKKYDYEVMLQTLRGGHGGYQQPIPLFFDFKSKFWYFLEVLQQATTLSMIPPLNLAIEFDEEEEIDFSKSTSSHTSQPSSISSSSTAATEQKSSAHVESPGYTLDHGPWLWRGTRHKKEQWHKISNFASYNKMLARIQENFSERAGRPPLILVTHSMDKVATDQWYALKSQEAQAERETRTLLKEQGFEDEDIGEPYVKWMLMGGLEKAEKVESRQISVSSQNSHLEATSSKDSPPRNKPDSS